MEHFLAGFFSGLWIIAIPVLVKFVRAGFRAGIKPETDFGD